MFTAVDLFAGGGALSVGLKNAGFAVSSAVECDEDAVATYGANHPEVKILHKDIRQVKASEITSDAKVDLLAGCPPCQGFTSLTAKYQRDDPRNDLILEMQRLVQEIRPSAVMMENVPGLAKKGRAKLDQFIEVLVSLDYKVDWAVLQVADYGTPQFRRRLVLLAGKGFRIGLPKPTHSRDGSGGLPKWQSVGSTIRNLPPPSEFKKGDLSVATVADWHVVRKLHPSNLERLKHAKPGGDWTDIPEHLRPPCHRGQYKGFSNVYGRLAWDQVAPTMTSGCTTLSRGRHGHPEALRTISVYEAALFQEFPPTFKLATPHMEHACRIIGNALPCGFATAMSKRVWDALKFDARSRNENP